MTVVLTRANEQAHDDPRWVRGSHAWGNESRAFGAYLDVQCSSAMRFTDAECHALVAGLEAAMADAAQAWLDAWDAASKTDVVEVEFERGQAKQERRNR